MRIMPVSFKPIEALQWVLVALSFVQATYFLSPLYRYSLSINGATPFAAALSHPALIGLWVIGLAISAAFIAIGIKKNRPSFRANGLFAQFLLRLYNLTLTILVTGWLPITWIYLATVVVFCAVLWGAERAEMMRRGT